MTHTSGHPPLLVLGYSEAAMVLRQPGGRAVKAVISIHGHHEFPVEVDAAAVPHRLVLRFDDVEAPDLTDTQNAHRTWVRQKWAGDVGRPLTPPTPADAGAIIDFARAVAGIQGTVLCQCQAGISRSPAAALICLATWTGKGQEPYCVEHLLRLRPPALPHPDLVRFADALLGRGGELIHELTNARSTHR